ncbi:MAG: hypothetical protein ACK46Y_14515 [Fluviicola sp.]
MMSSKDKNPLEMNLNDLQNIQKVDASPFLWTRIESKITQIVEDRVSKKQLVLYFASLVVLITINIYAFSSSDSSSNSDSNLADQLELVDKNQLYQ